MNLRSILFGLACGAFVSLNALGHYLLSETSRVPIDRLFANLQQHQLQNSNDFEVTYHLARLHSMAYSTNLAVMEVRKDDETKPVYAFPGSDTGVPGMVNRPGSVSEQQTAAQHLTNAIALYERAIVLLRKSTNVTEKQWLILPTQLGLAWCLEQAGRRDQAIAAYRKALKVAWKIEVTGDFNIQQWVKDVYDDVRSGRNPLHAQKRGFIGPGVCYSEETIGYLLKLLDPAKDATEIAQLKKDQQTLLTMGRAITPILVPLEADCALVDLVDAKAQVTFDLDGSGLARKWGWITPKAAWMVYDPDRSGRITSGLQMFGNVTFWIFWQDGYEALRALDDNGDGVLSGPELKGLALWKDLNGNGVSEPGEVIPAEALGITSISCSSERHSSGICWNPIGVNFKDGATRPTYDWIAPSMPVISHDHQVLKIRLPNQDRT